MIDRRQWILQNCIPGQKILDVGCADGFIFNNTPFHQYTTSVDIDKYNLPNFYQMDAHNLSIFKDKEFDIVILGEILEHVNDPVQVLKEANRVGKRILITVPDERNWDEKYFPYETKEQLQRRRNKTLEELVKESNPNTKEFYNDNYNHLYHNRHYTQSTLRQDLKEANINDYKLDNLRYEGWAFFTVDTNTNKEPIWIEDGVTGTVISKSIETKTTKTTNGPIFNYGFKSKEIINIKNQDITIINQTQKLRIALISTPFFQVPPKSYGGLEQVVYDLAMGLDQLGHTVTIFAPEDSISPPNGHLITTGPSINTVGVDWFEEEKKKYEVYKNIISLDKDFDIIHDHSWFSFVYLLKMSNPKLKVIHTHHSGYQWDSPPPSPIKPNLVAISKWMKQYTEQYFKQKGFNIHVEYIYNPVDIDKYKFQATKTDHLLFVGRLSTFKQPHIAINVARKSKHRLDLVGGSKFVDSIEYVNNLEKDIEKDPDITLYKDASHDLKIEKMQNAKALLLPSNFQEPFGLVAIESMACGTPVIALDDGALKEIILDGITGFICKTEDEMVYTVNNRIKDIDPKSCRLRAEQFSRLNIAKQYQELYYKVINNEEW